MCFLEQLRRKCAKLSLHASRVADPDLGTDAFLAPGSGMGKKSQDLDPGSGSGINIPDHISGSLETISGVKILKFFYVDVDADADPGSGNRFYPGSGREKIRIRDPV